MQQQGPHDKPSAPYDGELPPPYSAAMAGSQRAGDAPGSYPHMGFAPPPGSAPVNIYPHPAPQHMYPYAAAPQTAPPNTYPHPPAGYVQPSNVMLGAGQTQLPVNVIVSAPVGTEPVNLYCAGCAQQITSKVEYRTSWHTHLVAGIVCFSTMFFSMCCLGLVPYCLDSCKSAEHFCPNCNAFLGKYDRC